MESLKKKFLAVGAVICLGVTNAMAAIEAPDFTTATADITTIFTAVLGVMVVIFGLKKAKSMLR